MRSNRLGIDDDGNGARVITISLTVANSAAIDAAADYAWNTAGV